MTQHTHLNHLIVLLVKTLEARGADSAALLRQAGIEPSQLTRADGRLPVSQVDRLWEVLMAWSGNDMHIIVDTARRYDVGSLHVLGFGLQACANLASASERLARASAIFNTGLHASCASSGESFQLTFEFLYADAAPAKDIVTAAILLHTWRHLLRPGLAPLSVEFAHADPPTDPAMQQCLEDFFGCQVRYGQQYNRMTLPLDVALQALPTANPALAARGEAVVNEYLLQLGRSSFALAVARCIAGGVFHKEGVASELKMSTRTLQRRLMEEQLGFAQVLADTRRDMACTLLRSGRHTVKEVAYLLGYSDPANFSRAFRGWYGQVPDAFRRGDATSP